jgi:hypothetical protein
LQLLTSSRVACIIVYNVIMKFFDVLWRHVSLLVVCSMCLQTTRFCKLVGLACLKIYAWCFLSRHTVYGGTDCTKGNLCATIICSWSFEASSMLSKKVSNNPSEELSFFRPPNNVNTANNQCVHVVMYTTSLALLVWPLPADHTLASAHHTSRAHVEVLLSLLRLKANFAQVVPHHASAACSSSSTPPLNVSRLTSALIPAFLGPSRLSSCITTTCLQQLCCTVVHMWKPLHTSQHLRATAQQMHIMLRL